ncbi:hypothetical protein K469DRAFT_280367 [Zopfia rhizophila CBS 207.26]|uniref:Uncharacterized protein n=1 Tax=Zopfia rhizophila CBS 207.26 TaxID=1314779 RepID=A0A6A6EQ60_9PEZI|nr:hypothetical protein K469DRAFT_280367 [Zopfia rhizophila CBS 207.26]
MIPLQTAKPRGLICCSRRESSLFCPNYSPVIIHMKPSLVCLIPCPIILTCSTALGLYTYGRAASSARQ